MELVLGPEAGLAFGGPPRLHHELAVRWRPDYHLSEGLEPMPDEDWRDRRSPRPGATRQLLLAPPRVKARSSSALEVSPRLGDVGPLLQTERNDIVCVWMNFERVASGT